LALTTAKVEVESSRAQSFKNRADSTENLRIQALGEVEAKQELLVAEQELRQAEQNEAKQRQLLLGLIIGSVVLILLGAIFVIYKTNQSKKIRGICS